MHLRRGGPSDIQDDRHDTVSQSHQSPHAHTESELVHNTSGVCHVGYRPEVLKCHAIVHYSPGRLICTIKPNIRDTDTRKVSEDPRGSVVGQ